MPHDVTMPQLGMAQDAGRIVAWLKAAGDAVARGDALFEVETDKATMEIEAQADGFLTGIAAVEGDDVPVGAVIARISATAQDEAPAPAPAMPEPAAAAPPISKPVPSIPPAKPAPASGRILASPRARRIALAEGLDLARLVQAGHPQPFHVSDLDTLRALRVDPPIAAQTAPATAQRLVAQIDADGLPVLVAWAAEAHGLHDADAILASLAGSSLPNGEIHTIAILRHGTARTYGVPEGRSLSRAAPTDAPPDLILRDLRGTAMRTVAAGAAPVPTLTMLPHGAGLSITLECSAAQMDPDTAIALLCDFAGRIEDPLRHLL